VENPSITVSANLRENIAEVGQPIQPDSVQYYLSLTDEELDQQIIASTQLLDTLSAQKRREIQAKLLPALMVLRDRHAQPGRRNPVLGFPSWEEYLRCRNLKPDTVRSWFRRSLSANEVAIMLGEARRLKKSRNQEQDLQPGDVATLLLVFQKKLGKQLMQVFASLATDDYVQALRTFVEGMVAAQRRRVAVHVIPELDD
jgi:hypothetical protein